MSLPASPSFSSRTAAVIASVCIAVMAQPVGQGQAGEPIDGKPDIWLVTVGGWATLGPKFDGSDEYEIGFKPRFALSRAGSRQWLALPNDGMDVELFETDNFRMGPVASFRVGAETDPTSGGMRRFAGRRLAVEAGAFAELWPVAWLRTRIEAREVVVGDNGFIADFTADVVHRPGAWTLAAGPRLSISDSDYQRASFGARAADAGGVQSFGAGAMASYKWSEQWTTAGYVEFHRLVGASADGSVVTQRGSPDQVTVGIGATYTFAWSR